MGKKVNMSNISEENLICKDAYLYSTSRGYFEVMYGTVLIFKSIKKYFVLEDGTKVADCSGLEGDVYKHSIWLSERNDQKAKDILLKYQEEKIESLKKEIDRRLNMMNLIREGLIND